MLNRFTRSLFITVLLTKALCGCGGTPSNNGTVHGNVTFAGQPVSDATIRFENKDGLSQNADLNAEGKFQVQTYEGVGLPTGTYRVAVLPRVATNDPTPLVAVSPADSKSPEFPHIPPKFRSVKTSKLTIQVVRGKNPPFDFDLSK